MAVVKRIFRMVGTEGVAIRGVKRIFEREGLPTPEGKKIWGQFFIREAIRDDAYRPHSFEEIESLVAKGQMAAEVSCRQSTELRYLVVQPEADEDLPGGGERTRRSQELQAREDNPEVGGGVDSGTCARLRRSQKWVEMAREAIKDNVKLSQNDNRPWELSGGLARCAECGWAMRAHGGLRQLAQEVPLLRLFEGRDQLRLQLMLEPKVPPCGQTGATGMELRLWGYEEPGGAARGPRQDD